MQSILNLISQLRTLQLAEVDDRGRKRTRRTPKS